MIVVSITTFGQQGKPLNFGIELDGKLTKAESNTYFDSPTGAVYAGIFGELYLTHHFSGKLRAGINNTYVHQDALSGIGWTGEPFSYPALSKVTQTFNISLEPRYYFFSTEQSRKINLYAALPVTFETKSLNDTKYIFRTKLLVVPTLGIRYDFAKHWGIEAGGGLGWRRYGSRDDYKTGVTLSEVEYGLSVGIRYSFRSR